MTIPKLACVVAFISFFLSFFSCCTPNPVHSTTKKPSSDSEEQPTLQKIEFRGDLARTLRLSDFKEGRVNADLLKVQTSLENLTDKDISLIYKFEWLDDQDFVIKDSSLVWAPLFLRGGETTALQAVATSPKAQNFILKIQRAKNP